MSWLKRHGATLTLVMTAFLGIGLMLYPTFSDWWNSFHQSRVVMSYAKTVANMNKADYEKCLAQAEAYNRKLSGTGPLWTMTDEQLAEYNSQLALDDSGVMGYVSIPKINVQLPIYHGVDESVLQVAIGHLEGTSLPVGGEGTHCVISGHRGLPSARLFTDIDKIKEGDTWTLTVLDRTLTYECDQIRVVEPTDLSALNVEPGQDYCTLVTCTPYGINTHRLLVRGHRVANAQGDAEVTADALRIDMVYIIPFVCGPVLVLIFIIAMLQISRVKKRSREWKAVRSEFEEKLRRGKDRH